MKINSRNTLFWAADKLKKSRVRHYYDHIKRSIETNDVSLVCSDHEEKITELVTNVQSIVPFYRNQVATCLDSFPVVTKSIIKKDVLQFRSSLFSEKMVTKVSTSGSTGIPFTVYQDKEKKWRNTADTLYFSNRVGYVLGEKLFYFRLWDAFQKKSHWVQQLQNIVPVDVAALSENIGEIFRSMSKFSHMHCIGYVSAYETLCRYAEEQSVQPTPKIKSAIAISEALPPALKERFFTVFNCPLISRYSNSECGILAQQEATSHEYKVNTASYYIEILNLHTDTPVPVGTMGRIVVTDLYNKAMPLVRYDTGDLGMAASILPNGAVSILSVIEGRKIDIIYDINGKALNYNITHIFGQYPEVEQFQFIQKNRNEFVLKLKYQEDFKCIEEIVSRLQSYLGKEAIITVKRVEDIPLLPSGKRKIISNEMNEN